jgi:thioredoxin-related protein
LTVVLPTQHYGYVAGGEDAPEAVETAHIGKVRKEFYGTLQGLTPLSKENFRAYGCSTTPTLVLVDRAGVVRLYHPGKMTYEELLPHIKSLVGAS